MSKEPDPPKGGEAERDDPEAPLYSSVPLDTEDGEAVVKQQNVGEPNEAGGGEWPDPDTPPKPPAPGAG